MWNAITICLDYVKISYLGLRDDFFKPLLSSKIITGSLLLTKKVLAPHRLDSTTSPVFWSSRISYGWRWNAHLSFHLTTSIHSSKPPSNAPPPPKLLPTHNILLLPSYNTPSIPPLP